MQRQFARITTVQGKRQTLHTPPHLPTPQPLREVLEGHEPPIGGPCQQADLDHLFLVWVHR